MPQRVSVKRLRTGEVIPCNACKIKLTCAMYRKAKRIKHHAPATLTYCDLWEPTTVERGSRFLRKSGNS